MKGNFAESEDEGEDDELEWGEAGAPVEEEMADAAKEGEISSAVGQAAEEGEIDDWLSSGGASFSA
jgi:hypothetical protein